MTGSRISREVRNHLEKTGNLWLYPGEPRADVPHVILHSGKHSNGYVNVGGMLREFPEIREALANDVVKALSPVYAGRIDCVVGSATSATDLAGDVAWILGAYHIRMIKTDNECDRKQFWNSVNMPLRNGEVILQMEDLITTGDSALQVREGIRRDNPKTEIIFVPILPVVVDRSDMKVLKMEESVIMPLLWLSIQDHDPKTCIYCAVGSVALDAKENWAELIATSALNVETWWK